MLYLIYGTDTHKTRKKLHELLDLVQKKRPNSEVFKMNTESFSEASLEEMTHSQGLFENKYIVILDNLFEKKDMKETVLEKVSQMSVSDNIFFMIETKVDSSSLKKIEKLAEKTFVFDKREEKESTNIFSITNGLLEKNKKKLWISYIDFISQGVAPEEIHGIFFWQVKNMIIASRVDNVKDSGLSPFAYKNALSGSKKYKPEELIVMSNSLVDLTHRVRLGKGDLNIMLEKWVLGL